MKPGAYGRFSNFSGLKISTFQTFRDNLKWHLHFWMKHQCAQTGAISALILSQELIILSQSKTSDILIWYARKGFPRFSQVLKKSFLAYPTGISMNPTGTRKYCLTRGSVRRLSWMMSGHLLWRFDVILQVLTSCWRHFLPNVSTTTS